jgi:hypothetical protein
MRNTEDPTLTDRIAGVGRELETLRRCQELGAAEDDPVSEDLASLERRHADLHERVARIQADKPDAPAVDALEADLQGLEQSVRRWIEHQDTKAAPT